MLLMVVVTRGCGCNGRCGNCDSSYDSGRGLGGNGENYGDGK